MSELDSQFRLLWLEKINASSSKGKNGIAHLFLSNSLQIKKTISSPSPEYHFEFLSNWDDVIDAFANDAKRFSSAAIETVATIKKVPKIPKSTSWALIQLYYAAFYAAHGLARLWGTSITHIQPNHIRMIKLAATAQNHSIDQLKSGLHLVVADSANRSLTLSPINDSNSHECLWSFFITQISQSQEKIRHIGSNTPITQRAIAKLIEIEQSLSNSQVGANVKWMSNVRNAINYRHEYGTWHPYKNAENHLEEILFKKKPWQKNVEEISFWIPTKDRELANFAHACSALISMCRQTCIDMYERCPSGKGNSFQRYGVIGLLNSLGDQL